MTTPLINLSQWNIEPPRPYNGGRHVSRKEFSEKLYADRYNFYRVCYMPYVMASLAWDYFDTTANQCKAVRWHKGKETTRKLRKANLDFEKFRIKFIDSIDSERQHALWVEEQFSSMFAGIYGEIAKEVAARLNPQSPDHATLYCSAYMTVVVLDALGRYVDDGDRYLEETFGGGHHSLMTDEIPLLRYSMHAYLPDDALTHTLPVSVFSKQIHDIYEAINSIQIIRENGEWFTYVNDKNPKK